MSGLLKSAWTVFRKELVDALRDRRTLLTVLLSSVAMGPLVLVLLSALVSSMEERAEARELLVHDIAAAPTLRNYVERQTWTLKEAPADYEAQLRARTLGDPVLVVPKDFEARLARGEPVELELVADSANTRSAVGGRRVERLIEGFVQEQASLRLALRGVAPQLVQVARVENRDLADPASRAAQLLAMLPFFVLMAVVYGALNAALDTTAGERERGSLEPLLCNPASRWALVLGKWGAVAAVGVAIAVLSAASFLPGQWLLRNDALAALFRYGAYEAGAFVALLLPLAAAVAAVLMAVAIRCRSFKEAQASATVVVLAVSLAPLVSVFNQEGDAAWFTWVPALGQVTLMNRVLRGETLDAAALLPPVLVCAALSVVALAYVARTLRSAALK
ncbi:MULTISPECIES: ABC transporter permease [unclassified Rubrivivax]|uniref:ABC transporter permease n=1 Tax=unclassified Rubrivivax TaxID=2649762 RepID=UPI001E4BD508|nr:MULTISPECIES: ABC transporter permease subunit [unclassified Rubrivivax]MCC9596777.1 ABC transporter permease subunit [Rubrivivax sp. JA1055]MCC9648935.1 ABC transporter permease subunit [Rubrivivax sp. JA1029]MCD0421096.1 ABC transporter permease subunit [Rubrivivax sp. JA1024]